MEIARLTPEHAAAVAALWRQCFGANGGRDADLSAAAADERGLSLVVPDARGGVCAAVVGGFDGYRGWIYYLAVRADVRRRGLGTRLVKEMEKRFAAMGCRRVCLQVHGDGDASAFYKSLGYTNEKRASMGKQLIRHSQ